MKLFCRSIMEILWMCKILNNSYIKMYEKDHGIAAFMQFHT